MIKDFIIFLLAIQILIDGLSAVAIGRRLNAIEDRFFRKHEADIRHRNREVGARAEQSKRFRQHLHVLDRKVKMLIDVKP